MLRARWMILLKRTSNRNVKLVGHQGRPSQCLYCVRDATLRLFENLNGSAVSIRCSAILIIGFSLERTAQFPILDVRSSLSKTQRNLLVK